MSALDTVSTRPIHYSSQPAAVIAPLLALGLTHIEGGVTDAWQVLHAPGGGDVAVHAVAPGDALDGTTQLGFEADDLDAVGAALPASVTAEISEEAHGRALRVTAPDGLSFLVDARPARPVVTAVEPPYRLEVAQMWFTADVTGANGVLAALGAAALVTSPEPLGWVDARMPAGGRMQVHNKPVETPYVSAGFQLAGSLEDALARLHAAGFAQAAIIDESYGRYLELGPGGYDLELGWVNQEQADYYGYLVHERP